MLGDKTTHGGTVISASTFTETHGKGWARVGDKVACERCGGIYPIAEGDPSLIDDGLPVAYHGCKVACGAALIAGQMFTTDEPSSGGAVAAGADSAMLAANFGSIAADLVGGYQEEPLDEERRRFRGRFRVVDQATGEPISGIASCVRSTGGVEVAAATDSGGFTPWIERDASEMLSFELTDRPTAP